MKKFQTKTLNINPRVSPLAIITKVGDESQRTNPDDHQESAHNFLVADSLASGFGEYRNFGFVLKMPELINRLIQNKAWKRLYVAKAVVIPHYCCFTQGKTDVENFYGFVESARPNGLGTTKENIEKVLSLDAVFLENYYQFLASAMEPLDQAKITKLFQDVLQIIPKFEWDGRKAYANKGNFTFVVKVSLTEPGKYAANILYKNKDWITSEKTYKTPKAAFNNVLTLMSGEVPHYS